jgi:c-di-GMP-binding flagellar brake protein YcgR
MEVAIGEKRNRRDFPRVTLHQMVKLWHGRERFIQAEGINISRGGMLCKSPHPIDPADKMYVMFSLPSESGPDSTVEVEATVVHVHQEQDELYRFGIHFTDFSPYAQRVFDTFFA